MNNTMPGETSAPPPPRDQALHRRVTVVIESVQLDLEIRWSPRTASVADLIDAARADLDLPAPRCEIDVSIDGRVVAASTPLEQATLANGSIVAVDAGSSEGLTTAEATIPAGTLRLDHIAGSDAGGRVFVPLGAAAQLRHPNGETLSVFSASVPSTPALTSQTAPCSTRSTPVPGDYLEVGTEIVALSEQRQAPKTVTCSARSDGEPIPINRPPRIVDPAGAEMPARPPVPARPPDAPPLSWASLLAPIPIGIAMALLFRPYFLLFTAAGPMLFLGRWWEGKRRHRRATVEWEREVFDRSVEYHHRLDAMAQAATLQHRRRQPTVCELLDRVEHGDRRLWERRPTHEDFGVVALAYGDAEWPDEDDQGAIGRPGREQPRACLKAIPLVANLRDHRLVGVIGHDTARGVTRAMLFQLVALHGPAHLRIAASLKSREAWEWLKWLPHYTVQDRDVATGASGPWTLHLIDATASDTDAGTSGEDDVDTARFDPARLDTARFDTTIIVAPSSDDLPTRCSLLIDCRSWDRAMARPQLVVTSVETGMTTTAPTLIAMSQSRVDPVARRMAGFVDPEMAASVAALPAKIALADLEGWHDETRIVAAWHNRCNDALVAAVGAANGPYEIDLVRDGPHALVAGTTGSGKSELLRTWVAALAGRYSPRDCAFVLVDFKGGGAFDAVAELPHVAAVVTDLDEGLAQRGLRSLRAELREREHRLRAVGAVDIASYRRSGAGDLPRLVLIIDEFATLAAELPTFLDGLVDIAQRGRSLGVHLILATQRPAGVLDQKIRANTNLRICLRVQDSADSVDVIERRDAASLPRNRPGRALIRKGADEVRAVQCAHVGPSEQAPTHGLQRRRFDPAEPGLWRPGSTLQPGAVERIVAAAQRSAESDLVAPPQAPWCPPLPASLPRSSLWIDQHFGATIIPIGIEDRPDERIQPVWGWDRAAGPLLVVGGSDGERRAVFASVVDAVGREHRAIDTYVIHTEIGATPFALNRWAGAIDADDIERIDRVLLRCATSGPDSDPIVVIVERFDLLGAGANETDASILREHLERVVARAARSVSLVIGGATERSIPSRIAAHASQRLVLRLADSAAYAALGLRERTMPAIDAMGAVDPRESTAVRLAGAEDEDLAVLHYPNTRPISVAPTVLYPDALGEASIGDGEMRFPIGVDLVTHQPFVAHIAPDEPFLLVGERRSGRSVGAAAFVYSARSLRSFDSGLDSASSLVRIVIAGNPRSAAMWADPDDDLVVWPQDGAVRLGARIETLRSPALVVVDDADRIDDDEGTELVSAAKASGHFLVVACAADALRSIRSWTAALRSARNGVALGFGRGEAELIRSAPLRFCGIEWQPGRGIGASQSEPALVQLMKPPARSDSPHEVRSTMARCDH